MPSSFEMEVLGYVTLDYETVHTIKAEIQSDLAKHISDQELFTALVNLTRAGLVNAFEYNPDTHVFELISPDYNDNVKTIWFLAGSSTAHDQNNFRA